jgi:hypothetical protein
LQKAIGVADSAAIEAEMVQQPVEPMAIGSGANFEFGGAGPQQDTLQPPRGTALPDEVRALVFRLQGFETRAKSHARQWVIPIAKPRFRI